MVTIQTPAERVANGMKFLDAVAPTWLDKIDLDVFTLNSTFDCVLGQVFGDYLVAWNKFDFNDARVAELGFEFDTNEFNTLVQSCESYPVTISARLYGELEDAWRAAITARRQQKSQIITGADDARSEGRRDV